MSTLTTPRAAVGPATRTRRAQAHAPIPMHRIVWVELTKMFDTRSGFWLMAATGLLALVATGAVIIFAPDDAQTFESYASAIGMPMTVMLPVIAILSMTGEWSQRSVLTTFTLVPHRGRILLAKAVCAVGVGVVSMVVALGVGAVGNIVGTAISGAPTTWDVGLSSFALIILANVIGLLMGLTLGVVLRNSPAAIVGYFVWSLVLPNVLFALGTVQEWFADAQPWIDLYYSSMTLYDEVPTGEQWAQIGTSALIWMALPLAFGIWRVHRAEVK